MVIRKKGANGFPSRLKKLFYQFVASAGATTTEDIASIVRTHALAEPMNPFVPPIVGLKGSFHVRKDTPVG